MTGRLDLRAATVLLVVTWTLHTADHVRRGFAILDDGVVVGGTLVAMVIAALVTLVAVGHGAAPVLAAATGPAIAVGVGASHLLPEWGWLSDPLPGGDVDAWTWMAVLGEIGAAIVVGVVGWRIARDHGYSRAIPTTAWAGG